MLVLLCLLGLHVIGAVNITCRITSRRVDHVADAVAPAILENTAGGFPADVALAGCLVMDVKLSSVAQDFDLRDGSVRARYGVALVGHDVGVSFLALFCF